jgi:hypothetical protein
MDEGLRAEAIFHNLAKARHYTQLYPSWNLSINLNGFRGGVDVKVWNNNEVVWSDGDVDTMFVDMLTQALAYMETRLGPLPAIAGPHPPDNRPASTADKASNQAPLRNVWRDYAACTRCHVQMGQPCRSLIDGSVLVKPHYGRLRFSKANSTF